MVITRTTTPPGMMSIELHLRVGIKEGHGVDKDVLFHCSLQAAGSRVLFSSLFLGFTAIVFFFLQTRIGTLVVLVFTQDCGGQDRMVLVTTCYEMQKLD